MKRFIALAIILIFITGSMQAFGEGVSKLTYDIAKDELLKHNTAIKVNQNNERQAYYSYYDSTAQAYLINPKGTEYGGTFIEFDLRTKIQMTTAKELPPEQAKNAWDGSIENCRITENKLLVSLRDVFLALTVAYNNLQIEESKLKLAEKIWKGNREKLAKGLIAGEDADDSEYQYLKAKEDMNAAARAKENSLRSFNSFTGLPLDTSYDSISYKEEINNNIEDVDSYINNALAQRQEIKSVQRDISAKEHQQSIIEQDKMYTSYPDIVKDRTDVIFETDVLKTKLDKTKTDIINEIKNAYIDAVKQRGEIKSLKNDLDAKNLKLKKVTAQYTRGLITSNEVDRLTVSVNQAENSYNYAIYNYNTAVMKLENAVGLGPAYS